MKKTLFTLLSVITIQAAAFGQTLNFSHSSGTYTPLTNTTSVSGSQLWDDEDYPVQIGFTFNMLGTPHTEVTLNTNGVLLFQSGANEQYYIGYYADLEHISPGSGTSPIVTTISGTPGNRIRKFEWVNSSFYSSPSDLVNFQIWLYEANGKLETHVGQTNISSVADAFDNETGPSVGYGAADTATFALNGEFLTGDPSAPTTTAVQNASDLLFLSGVPANGKVYTFSSGVNATSENTYASTLQLFPNPFTQNFLIKTNTEEPSSVRVFDGLGRLMSTQNFGASANILVDMAAFPAGYYLVEITQNNLRSTQKVKKQ